MISKEEKIEIYGSKDISNEHSKDLILDEELVEKSNDQNILIQPIALPASKHKLELFQDFEPKIVLTSVKRPGEMGTEENTVLPPILDDKIKYKKVKSKPVTTKEIKNEGTFKEQTLSEKHRFLISGHVRPGNVPVYIFHQRYYPNVLQNYVPDFVTYKKEDNIEIFLKGKFFTNNILEEETKDSSAFLNIKPNKIMINRCTDVQDEKFKYIYNFGSISILIEGDFLTNNDSLKLTPVLHFDILRRSSPKPKSGSYSIINDKQNEKTVLNNIYQFEAELQREAKTYQAHKGDTDCHKTDKSVCLKDKTCLSPGRSTNTVEKLKNSGFICKVSNSKIYKKMFVKGK